MSTEPDQGVVVWGELLWDLFPDGPQLGGAPSNVAWHLGLAGGWPRLVTRIGDDDEGRRALARLDPVVDTSLVQIDRERATGIVEVAIADGEPRYRLVPGRAWQRIACTAEVRAALADAGVLVYGTLAQLTDEGLEGWRAAIAATPPSCLKVCNVNLRKGAEDVPPIAEAIAAADVVKVNDRELDVLAGWYGWTDPIRELRAERRIVALTHGASGSTLFGETGSVTVPGVAARPGGDNVGCGDAYLAILVHGMTLGWDLASCGGAAARWAAAVASARGATPHFGDAQVEALLGEP
jgi:fructokinase